MNRPTPLSAIIAVALLIAVGCAGSAGGEATVSRPVPLVLSGPMPERIGGFTFRGAVAVTAPGLGGLSGLSVSADGRQFVAVSDRGDVVRGRFGYDGDGNLAAVHDVAVEPLPLDDESDHYRRRDAEELAPLPDGGWLVAFEHVHRILRYPPGFDRSVSPPVALPTPPGLKQAPSNGGLEALAVLAGGRIVAVEEGNDDGTTDRPAWIGTPPLGGTGGWQRFTYRAAAGFRPTGATVLPSGDVLVLERWVSFLGGWSARIVRVAAEALRPGALVAGEELARIEPPLIADNFEGISAVPGPDGAIRIFLVSDDNFSVLQRTLFVALDLPAAATRRR